MQNLKTLVDEKIANNQDCREAMLALIASGEAIAFVGSGLSCPLKYPSWNNLLEKLHSLANGVAPFDPPDVLKLDALQYAEEIKQHFTKKGELRKFNNAIGREFMPRDGANCTTTHIRLIKLPFRSFVTTNYDDCLEQALLDFAIEESGKPPLDPGLVIKPNKADVHLVSTFVRSIVANADKHQRRVGHIHGRHNDTANIILAASDYENAYGLILKGGKQRDVPSLTLHRQLAWALFATRRLVFFGCRMEDPYIKALLDMVVEDLWEWDQPIHFVVLPIDEESVLKVDGLIKQFQRCGLQPVLFDNCNGNFSNLDQLLEEAFERPSSGTFTSTRQDSPSAIPSPTLKQPSVPAAKTTPAELASTICKPSEGLLSGSREIPPPAKKPLKPTQPVGPEWLEDINKTTESSLKKDEN